MGKFTRGQIHESYNRCMKFARVGLFCCLKSYSNETATRKIFKVFNVFLCGGVGCCKSYSKYSTYNEPSFPFAGGRAQHSLINGGIGCHRWTGFRRWLLLHAVIRTNLLSFGDLWSFGPHLLVNSTPPPAASQSLTSCNVANFTQFAIVRRCWKRLHCL